MQLNLASNLRRDHRAGAIGARHTRQVPRWLYGAENGSDNGLVVLRTARPTQYMRQPDQLLAY